ncbi:MAG: carboxynorspermidine decarboxylase, partial [Muribaculaceae bacterium]|nr:carboxynorspermidine decarboxylase [Muribaculaceae bacterium]
MTLPTPYYIVYEDRLRANLELITDVARRSGATIIMAFKANALWRTFPIIAEYCRDCTASSVNELRLGREFLGGHIHSYSPAYTDATIEEFIAGSTHITFNSLSQLERYGRRAAEAGVSVGLRVNPKVSVVDTDLYNPALPGSRLGVDLAHMPAELPPYVEG